MVGCRADIANRNGRVPVVVDIDNILPVRLPCYTFLRQKVAHFSAFDLYANLEEAAGRPLNQKQKDGVEELLAEFCVSTK